MYIPGVLTNGNADLTSSEHPNELAEFLNFSISAVETGAMKPSRVPYLTVLHRTNIHPSRILFIGDSLSTDIMGANLCGMHSVLIDRVNWPLALVKSEEGEEGQNYDHLNDIRDMIDANNSAGGATSRDTKIVPDIYLGMYTCTLYTHTVLSYILHITYLPTWHVSTILCVSLYHIIVITNIIVIITGSLMPDHFATRVLHYTNNKYKSKTSRN